MATTMGLLRSAASGMSTWMNPMLPATTCTGRSSSLAMASGLITTLRSVTFPVNSRSFSWLPSRFSTYGPRYLLNTDVTTFSNILDLIG